MRWDEKECSRCSGKGYITNPQRKQYRCPECHGAGVVKLTMLELAMMPWRRP